MSKGVEGEGAEETEAKREVGGERGSPAERTSGGRSFLAASCFFRRVWYIRKHQLIK